jgi:cysteine dioxygenase
MPHKDKPETLDNLIAGITHLTKDKTSSHDILRDDVKAYMNSYTGQDWRNFCLIDDSCYTRNRIYLDPEERFELIVLCWNISQMTPIHNHPESQCFFKLLQGELSEKTYQMPKPGKNKRMKVVEENIYNKIGETGYIDDGMGVHLVENCSPSEVCVTLHLYAPAYKNVNTYDESTGKVHRHGCGNYSVRGIRCERNQNGCEIVNNQLECRKLDDC